MPTMQDIADRAGVARATVSNVLTGRFPAKRSDAARRAAQIRRIATQLGYRPSTAARAVRTGRTGFIGMIRSPSLAYSVCDHAFEFGLDEALHARGLCLLRDIIDEPLRQNSEHAQAPRIVRENAVDGLLINYAFGTPPAVRQVLDRCRLPAIWINRKREENCVRPNDQGAAIEATRYLIQRGHRHIGFVCAPAYPWQLEGETHYSGPDRLAGYEQTLRQAGLPAHRIDLPLMSRHSHERVGHLLRCYVDLLRRPDRPSAVLCDGGGREMCHAAALLGLRVPQDLSVMTFDNDAGGDERVAVDRVLVRYWAMGRVAVSELCALIDQPDRPRPAVLIPFEFHQAGTVAAPGPNPLPGGTV